MDMETIIENNSQNICVFCKMKTFTRKHHLIPKCKSGNITVDACETCESFLHHRWTHNELRDVYNSVEVILANKEFQKFLKWRSKQLPTVLFKSERGKFRDKNKYH
jgi:hypothetical protein